MNVLALETSVTHGSLAVWRENKLIGSRTLPSDEKTATSLFTAVDAILKDAQLKPAQIDLIAISTGPGSFTGLRIGVTFAKTFAYATNAQIAAVPTALALAYGALADGALDSTGAHGLDVETKLSARANPTTSTQRSPGVEVVIDAQRQQLFVQSFRPDPQGWPVASTPIQIVGRADWWGRPHTESLVTGPGLRVLEKTRPAATVSDSSHAPRPASLPEWIAEPLREPNAVWVGEVGLQFAKSNRTTSLWQLKPEYGRQSAAEEKANQSN